MGPDGGYSLHKGIKIELSTSLHSGEEPCESVGRNGLCFLNTCGLHL